MSNTETAPYLIFRLRESRYAVDALAVREIVPLPEIAALEETPSYVVGVANLRGQIVPVIDLDLRFGHAARRYSLDDCVIFLERGETAVGIIVNEVQNVRDIALPEVAPIPFFETELQPDSHFLVGLVKADEQVIKLLHLENLLLRSHLPREGSDTDGTLAASVSDTFCPEASAEESAVFRERAKSLAQPPESQDSSGLLPLAVVRLGEEFFGIELPLIREFAEVRSVTPVPCCPKHIVGQMNLRGDLITVVDVAATLGLRPTQKRESPIVVVANSPKMGAGVLVDEVIDVLYLRAAEVANAPGSVRAPGKEYLRGTASSGSQMLSILDLPALLMDESLLVDQTP